MSHLFPPIEPYRTGRLKVSDLHEIHYEECGNPQGQGALFVHGGPGVGIVPAYRRFFDPSHWRIVLPDQRGAGQSTPHAELRENTTWELIEDFEKLRKQLGIDKWVVMGGSWGSFLSVAYAIMHPEAVSGVIIRGVMLGRKKETDWLFKQGMNWMYPDAWEKFTSLVLTDPAPPSANVDYVRAYNEMMNSDDPEIVKRAAIGWSKWEGAANQLVPPEGEDMFDDLHRAISIARIESWYTLHNWFLKDDNWLLENLHRMHGVPLWIVQGRFDLICPPLSAWELHRAHPKSKLKIVQLGAHSPVEEPMAEWMVKAAEQFKSL